jgi:hypothetical protein
MADDPLVLVVRWRTGAIGCLLPLLVAAAVLFGVAAFSPSLVEDLSHRHGGGFLRLTTGMDWGGVNVPVALLALYLAFETFRFGWRWADQYAVKATADGLVPHGSMFRRPMRWADIADVRFAVLPNARARVPALVIDLKGGRRLIIRGVDNADGQAERFAELVRKQLELRAAES